METVTITKYIALCVLIGSLLGFIKVMESLYLKGRDAELEWKSTVFEKSSRESGRSFSLRISQFPG